MVKTTTKINTHELKLIHDGNKKDLCSRRIRRRRSRWGRGSRSRGSIHWSKLHIRLLGSQMCITLPNRFLADGTPGIERSRERKGDMHVWEDACDSWKKDELITCSNVLIDIYYRFYHVWRKIYRKILHERKKKRSTRLSDSVIVRQWLRTKVITIYRILGPLANSVVEKFRVSPHTMAFSQNSEAISSQEIEWRRMCLG